MEGQSELADRVDKLEARFRDAFEGVAVSLAIPTATIEPTHNFAFAGNIGTFQGENALGLAVAARLNEHLTLQGGVAVGLGHSVVGGRGGFNLSW